MPSILLPGQNSGPLIYLGHILIPEHLTTLSAPASAKIIAGVNMDTSHDY